MHHHISHFWFDATSHTNLNTMSTMQRIKYMNIYESSGLVGPTTLRLSNSFPLMVTGKYYINMF